MSTPNEQPVLAPRPTVAVDIDGVLADFSAGWRGVENIGDPIPGAVEFTRRLSEFADVVIWTTRTNPQVGEGKSVADLRGIVRRWLGKHGFHYADIWTGQGKPIAAAFIDDRAVWCAPGWLRPMELDIGEDYSRMRRFGEAISHAKEHCENVPPGCSLSHTTPVLAADSEPFGKAEELEALRARAAHAEANLLVMANRADMETRRRMESDARVAALEKAMRGLLDAIDADIYSEAPECGQAIARLERCVIDARDALGQQPIAAEEPTR